MVKSLSVFFPAFNEEGNIKKAVQTALEVLKTLKLDRFEVIVVNDGSSDGTSGIVASLAANDKRVREIVHNPNKGYGEAIKSGLMNSQYEWIFYTDADNQFDFKDITKFIEAADNAQLIIGYRLNRKDPLVRKINGWAWTMLNNVLFGLWVRDVDCAFKLIKKQVMDTIEPLESTRGAMISPELLAKSKKAGFKIYEIGVKHYPRLNGEATGGDIRVIIKSFMDLFKLWWKIK